MNHHATPLLIITVFCALALFLFSGCLGSDTFLVINSDANIDGNKLLVDVNDSTPGYLGSKLVGSPDINLAILNVGGNEKIQIDYNGTASGGIDTNVYTAQILSVDSNAVLIDLNLLDNGTRRNIINAQDVNGRTFDFNKGEISSYIDFISTTTNIEPVTAGQLRVHAFSTQGFSRLEQDNEGATDIIFNRDQVIVVRNMSGITLSKGSPVYVTGSTGNVPNVAYADANDLNQMPAIGIVLDSISTNNFGQVMVGGIISNFNTSAFATGEQVYVSPITPGALTNVRPVSPYIAQRMGSILVSGISNGSLLVKIAPFLGGLESGTLSDFNLNTKDLFNADDVNGAHGNFTSTLTAGGHTQINNDLNVFRIGATGLIVTSDTYPATWFKRTSAATNSVTVAHTIEAKTSGDMADGYGAGLEFRINDSAGTSNPIGQFSVVRSGADNSGVFNISTYNAGAVSIKMSVNKDGNVRIGANGGVGGTLLHIDGDTNHGGRILYKNAKYGLDGNRWYMATGSTRCFITFSSGGATDSNCPTA